GPTLSERGSSSSRTVRSPPLQPSSTRRRTWAAGPTARPAARAEVASGASAITFLPSLPGARTPERSGSRRRRCPAPGAVESIVATPPSSLGEGGCAGHTERALSPTPSPTGCPDGPWTPGKAPCYSPPEPWWARRSCCRSSRVSGRGGMSRQHTPPFGALLKELRIAAGLTQEALSERAGLSVRGL